ncbi:lantibiotic dehydratase [Tistrella bauzanensis]|uniref:Lantibiotic dehydratase n=1 Tax=Tistrella arctica TaxID=3133430 RepID=A0ABU9YIG3_9PROT
MTIATPPPARRPGHDADAPASSTRIEWFPLGWMRGAGFGFHRLTAACLPDDVLSVIDDDTVPAAERQAVFAGAAASGRRRLVAGLTDPLAAEALFLSNRDAPARITELAAENLDQPRKRARQKLRLAWSYLQRFAAKNDTASFFGPVAWGVLDPDAPRALALTGTPDRLIGARHTVIEHWVAEALAQAVAADPALQNDLPLALNPGCTVLAGNRLHLPVDRQVALPPLHAAILSAVAAGGDSGLHPHDIHDRLRPQGHDPGRVTAAMAVLAARRVLLPAIRPAPGGPAPLAHLDGCLAAIGTPAAAGWRVRIRDLAAARDDFAAGDLPARMMALDRMHALLTEMGADRARQRGQMYVGRQPVYEDCARGAGVVLGGPLLAAATTDLAPVLALYRAVATAAAALIAARQSQVFDRLSADDGNPDTNGSGIDLVRFLATAPAPGLADEVVAVLEPALRAAWDALAGERMTDPASHDEISLRPDDPDRIATAVSMAIAGLLPADLPVPATLGLDIASPDLMIAAASIAAINRGDYRLVIGEVHPAVLTAAQPVAMPFCPDPSRVVRTAANWAMATARADTTARLGLADDGQHYQRSHIDWPDDPAFVDIALPGDLACGMRKRVRAADCRVMRDSDGRLVVRTRCGLVDDLGTVTQTALHRAMFALAAAVIGRHLRPRLVLGRLIVKRRSWRVAIGDPRPGGKPAEDAAAFRAMRAWARDLGLPPAIFAKAPGEPKPVCILLDAPQGAEMLARLLERPEPIDLSEMRPAPDELWLDAGQEGAVTAEFRLSTRITTHADARPSTLAAGVHP